MPLAYPVLSGVLCRILLYASVAYDTYNAITLEFSTPRFVLPTNILFCFNRPSFTFTPGDFEIAYLEQGGDIFSVSEVLVAATPYQSWRFFTFGANANFDAAEFGTVYDVLGTDPYYARSYTNQRWVSPPKVCCCVRQACTAPHAFSRAGPGCKGACMHICVCACLTGTTT